MYQSVWKLTALAVVVGIGVLVVVQAQRGFNKAEQDALSPADGQVDDATAEDSEARSSQAEPELTLDGFDDEGPAVPASAKTNLPPRRGDRPNALDGDDPFARSDEPRDRSPRRAASRAESGERTAARTRRRSSTVDEELSTEGASDAPGGLGQADDDEPFATESSRQLESPAMKREKTVRGPALRASLLQEDDQNSIGASTDAPAIEKNSGIDNDSEPGPQLLREDDEAPPRLRPVATDDDDPFDDDKPVARHVPAIEPSVAHDKDDDEHPSALSDGGLLNRRPKPAGPPTDDRDTADDELPIIERAPPQRKPATPSIPRVDAAADDEADAFPAIGKRAADDQEPRRLAPESELSLPLDDEPAKRAEKSSARTRADPFADDAGEDDLKATPARPEAANEPEPLPRNRPAAPVIEEDDESIASPPTGSTVKPKTDESDDPAQFHVEPPPARPAPSPAPSDEVPAREIPEPKPVDETDRQIPTPTVESPPVARRRSQPQLTIGKIAPSTAVLGKPMVYQIVVKNVGPIEAREVVVEDAVPQAARIDGSIPQALLDNQRLIWKLGTLEPGREKKILVRMIPQAEGTLGTVATVNCATADRDANPAAPHLKFDVITPSQAVVGTPVALKFRVANVGEVDANGVVIRNVLPAALRHPDGDDLEYEIGALPAGKSREVELTLTAAQAGKTVNRAIVTAEGNVTEEASAALEIVGPALTLTRNGSKRIYPGKSGSYTNTVTNPDSRPIANVRVVETIPPGMEFGSASDGGQYDSTKRTVTWTIDQLGPQASRSLKVTLNATGRGAQISVVRAYDASGASGETVGTTQVAGVPALTIDVGELAPHTDLGEQVRVPVRLLNRGSDTATNIRASVTLPTGMELVSIKAPVDYKVGTDNALGERIPNVKNQLAGNPSRAVIRFAPIKRLEARADVSIELILIARQAGNARLRIEVECEQIAEPVSREEITTIIAPQE